MNYFRRAATEDSCQQQPHTPNRSPKVKSLLYSILFYWSPFVCDDKFPNWECIIKCEYFCAHFDFDEDKRYV